jgi:hypothetical protein
MNPAPQAQSAPDARLAGGLMNLVQRLQKNRLSGARQLQGAPIGGETSVGPEKFDALLTQLSQNGQEQNAAPAPGALQKERSEEGRRQRNVGQREEESRPGEGSQVQGTEEEERQRRRMR